MTKAQATPDYPILSFLDQASYERWLNVHHAKSAGIWVRFYKKSAKVKSITYAQALDVALCYGWIDSQVKRYDEQSYLQKFTPRRSRSVWSQINTEKAEQLIRSGKMRPAGLAQVDAAKRDGRWARAYASSARSVVHEDFARALAQDQKAQKFYSTLSQQNKYAIYHRIAIVKKPETRARKIAEFVAMLSRGEKFY